MCECVRREGDVEKVKERERERPEMLEGVRRGIAYEGGNGRRTDPS